MDVASKRNPVEVLADEFVERMRRGERPTIREYAEAHPELAPEILELFPALEMLQMVADDTGDQTPIDADAWPSPSTRRLGDYRLLRVLGQGGMGTVYEAVQESLGRHVAVKVLSRTGGIGGKYRQRFRREAQAAARLHHTNIVPVYDFGEEAGTPYYAMQYIHGRGLDDVLVELRRQRDFPDASPAEEAQPGPPAVSGRVVARSLTSGRFVRELPEPNGHADRRDKSSGRVDAGALGFTPRVSAGSGPAASPPSLLVAPPVSDTFVAVDDPTAAPLGNDDIHSLSGTGATYWRSIASIGLQAAEALDYAHGQGVLHRDVKPGNLLLDVSGRVWVADFGLAKADDDSNLTRPDDVLGTLRYLPPESLSGSCDRRSDIYSLGLTLYELAAFRPAFEQRDRSQLLRAIAEETPPRLSKLRAEIPRDLETVIHKAIDRLPAARYPTAGDLADDLRCFLRGKPVHARRISPMLRLARWARRNPVVAGLSAAVLVLVLTGLVVTSMASLRFRELAGARERARQSAVAERRRALAESVKAQDAARLALERLYAARIAEATARNSAGQPGQRFESLAAIQDAVQLGSQLGYGTHERLQLRNLAVASLALPDLQVERTWQALPFSDTQFDLSADLERYLYWDWREHPRVSICRVDGNSEVRHIMSPRVVRDARWTRDGKRLRILADCEDASSARHQHLYAWDVKEGRLLSEGVNRPPVAAYESGHGGGPLVVCTPTGGVLPFDQSSGEPLGQLTEKAGITLAYPSPGGDRIAVVNPAEHSVEIYDVESRKLLRPVPLASRPEAITDVAWHPGGDYLALARGLEVQVYHTRLELPPLVLKGHISLVTRVMFSRDGTLLFSTGWDRQTRVWSAHDARLWLTTDAVIRRVGEEGRRAGFVQGTRLGIWRVATASEYRIVHASEAEGHRLKHAAIHPDGHLLATSGQSTGIILWDAARLTELAVLPVGRADRIVFGPSGDYLYQSSRDGIFRWPIQRTEHEDGCIEYSLRPREEIELPVGGWPHHIAIDAAGKTLATDIFQSGKLVVAHLDSNEEPLVIQTEPGLMYVDVSPDGRWVATGNYHGGHAEVFDTHSGESVLRINDHRASPAFSSDGRFFVVNREPGLQIFEAVSWRELHPFADQAAADFEYTSHPVFSPEASRSFLAIAARDVRGIVLLDLARGEHVATLRAGPGTVANEPYCFSPDGNRLYLGVEGKSLAVWDLAQLRGGLAELGLDWSASPLPETSVNQAPPVLRVSVRQP